MPRSKKEPTAKTSARKKTTTVRKAKTKKTEPTRSKPIDVETLDGETLERNAAIKKVVLTVNDDPLAAWIVQKKYNIPRADAVEIIAGVRREISAAASGSRRDKLGESLARLNEIYKTSIQTMDARTALSVTKELSKTQRLYNTYEDKETNEIDPEKEAARAILQSAVEGGENMTLDELARALVYLVIRLQTK